MLAHPTGVVQSRPQELMAIPSRSVYDAVLSYQGRDKEVVEAIAQWLGSQEGLRLYLDKGSLASGEPVYQECERALAGTRCLVVFLGPEGLGRWQSGGPLSILEAALRANDELRLLPVLLPGVATELRPRIPLYFQRRLWVQFDQDAHEDLPLRALARGIRRLGNPAALPAAIAYGRRSREECPYRGLKPFEEADAPLFFGRDAVIQRFLLHLHTSRCLAVAGTAASGRTSVIQAGLVPEMRAQGWLCALLTPGPEPIQQLAQLLWRLQTEKSRWTLAEIVSHLREAGAPILTVLADEILDDRRRKHLLLVIDSFEDVFTETIDPAQRDRFFQLITAAASAHEPRVRIVLSVRSDYLGHCACNPALASLILHNLVLVGPLAEREARAAIAAPAFIAGVALEDGLVDEILGDLRSGPDDLLRLSHTLEELFRRREFRGDRDTLTRQAYREMGGIDGSIRARADAEWARVEAAHGEAGTAALRNLFALHLVQPRHADEEIPRPAPVAELSQLGPTREAFAEILNDWIDSGLLVRTPPPGTSPGGDPAEAITPPDVDPTPADRIEMAHEALLRRWPRLRDWLLEHRGDVRAIAVLRCEADQWRKQGRPSEQLLTGSRLIDAEDLAARFSPALPGELAEFIEASVQERDAMARGRVETLERDLDAAQAAIGEWERALQDAENRVAMEGQKRAEAVALAEEQVKIREETERRATRLQWLLFTAVVLLIALGFFVWARFGDQLGFR